MSHSVSVAIPTYNRVGTLKRAVNSVYAQTIEVDEIIITDNMSTDGTEDYVRELMKSDERMVYQKVEGNLVDNWKAAFELCNETWIKYVFDDDWLEPNCIERLTDPIDAYTEIVQCGAWFEPAHQPTYHTFQEGWNIPSSVRQGILSVSPVTALHHRWFLEDAFDLMDQLSDSCYESGVGPNVLMNYWMVKIKHDGYFDKEARETWHRHVPDLLVHLGGDDLPGEQRSLTSRLWAENPDLIWTNHNEAYDLLDKWAA